MQKEIWLPILDCNKYEVSNCGNVRHTDSKLAVQEWDFKGYRMLTLTTNEGRRKQISVHRAVAIAFIPNPLGKEQVNHKDAVRTNNSVENLEWVTAGENMKHSRNLPNSKRTERAVEQFSLSGDYIAEYTSITAASRCTGVNLGGISSCCSGRTKTAGGFIWKRQ